MSRARSEVIGSLTRQGKGFELRQGGRDHDFLFFVHHGLTRAVFTKVSRGSKYKELGDDLLSRMSRQLFLTRQQFDSLIDCTWNAPEIVNSLRARGYLVS